MDGNWPEEKPDPYAQIADETIFRLPAAELQRVIDHPMENGVTIYGETFYGEVIDHHHRKAVIKGKLAIEGRGDLNVEAIIVMPNIFKRIGSWALRREPTGQLHCTSSRLD